MSARIQRITLLVSTLAAFPAFAGANPPGREADIQVLERTTKQRVYVGEDGNPQVIRTNQLAGFSKAIVGFTKFYSDESDRSAFDIQLNLVDSSGEPKLTASVPDACEVEGGSPKVRSFFFINADKESDLEIGVICSWKDAAAAECPQFDQVRFFKLLQKPNGSFEFERLENQKFKTLYHAEKSSTVADLKCEGAPNFKSAADVKRMISKIKF